MTKLIKSGLIIASLLIIPGLLMQVNAQYDIPDIPSQEDIEKMMQQQDVSGTYTNTDYGVSVVLPDGWSGMASDFQDPETGAWVTGFQVMDGGLASNMDAMQEGKFTVIMLSILDKSEDNEPPEAQPPTDDEYDFDCSSEMTAEKIKANGKDVMKIQVECSGDEVSMKTRAYHYATADKIVMIAYSTSPASDFDNHIDIFEDSVKTLTVDNLIDVDYEIPDDMMVTSTDSDETMDEDHDDTMEKSDDSMDDSDDTMEMTDEEEHDEDMEMTEKVMSPRKQMQEGTAAADVACNEGKELMLKTSTGAATCVKSSSVSKLVERGWGTLA